VRDKGKAVDKMITNNNINIGRMPTLARAVTSGLWVNVTYFYYPCQGINENIFYRVFDGKHLL
jgi:hypothetical protein